jgi:hypothetical protein
MQTIFGSDLFRFILEDLQSSPPSIADSRKRPIVSDRLI